MRVRSRRPPRSPSSTWFASFAGPGVSLANSVAALNSKGAPAGTVTLSAPATGGSFTSVTTIDTVAGADSACPSDTVNVNASVPKKSAAGVYEAVTEHVRFFASEPS